MLYKAYQDGLRGHYNRARQESAEGNDNNVAEQRDIEENKRLERARKSVYEASKKISDRINSVGESDEHDDRSYLSYNEEEALKKYFESGYYNELAAKLEYEVSKKGPLFNTFARALEANNIRDDLRDLLIVPSLNLAARENDTSLVLMILKDDVLTKFVALQYSMSSLVSGITHHPESVANFLEEIKGNRGRFIAESYKTVSGEFRIIFQALLSGGSSEVKNLVIDYLLDGTAKSDGLTDEEAATILLRANLSDRDISRVLKIYRNKEFIVKGVIDGLISKGDIARVVKLSGLSIEELLEDELRSKKFENYVRYPFGESRSSFFGKNGKSSYLNGRCKVRRNIHV